MDRGLVPPSHGSNRGSFSRQQGWVGGLLQLHPSNQEDGRFSPYSQMRGPEILHPHWEVQDGKLGRISVPELGWFHSTWRTRTYLHMPIGLSHGRFLRFTLRDPTWVSHLLQWGVHPFGLAKALWLYMKFVAQMVAHLHFRNISMYTYIDDIFHAHDSVIQDLGTKDMGIWIHLHLGFIINLTKSSLVPSQVVTHLGASIGMLVRVIRPTPDKVQEISQGTQHLLDFGYA